MEISELHTAEAHATGAEMQVETPEGKKLDCFIMLPGVDSAKWRGISRRMERETILAKDDEAKDAIEAKGLADAALDWRGFTQDGKELPFSNEALFDLFKNAPYIKDQVNYFIGTRKNFTKK